MRKLLLAEAEMCTTFESSSTRRGVACSLFFRADLLLLLLPAGAAEASSGA